MTKKCMHIYCVFSYNIYHQHVSIAVATIFRLTYRNTRNENNLSKHIREPLCIPNILLSYPEDGCDGDLNTLVINSKTLEDGEDRLFRNIGKKLSLLIA